MSTVRVYFHSREIDLIYLGDAKISIGRDSRSRIQLNSNDISTQHGEIIPGNDGYIYRDLGSTNGSLINGHRITEALLNDGDEIQLGDFTLRYDRPTENEQYQRSERTMAVNLGLAQQALTETVTSTVERSRSHSWLNAICPARSWIKLYHKDQLKPDVLAGLTIAALLVPQGMAYALLAGLPPVHGLYASILPLLIYALMGTSRHLSVAPVALDSLLVATGVSVIAQSGTEFYIQTVVVLTLMIGLIQLIMGILKLGFVVNFLSRPVLTGFTMAAAIIIAVSQLNNLLGLNLARSDTFHERFMATMGALPTPHPWTATIGILGIVLLNILKRTKTPIPGPVVLLFTATLASWLLGLENHGVSVVGTVPSGLPSLQLILPSAEQALTLLPLAFTLACIGFMGALSTGKNYAPQFGYRINPNAEFRALGLANLGSSVSGGFAVSGSLSRTAVNVNLGAKTPVSSIVSGIAVLISVAFLTPLFYHVPIPALAAILITSVVGLVNVAEVRYLLAVKPLETIVLAITLFATLAFGFSTGLLSGILAALIVHIVIQTRPNISHLGRLPQTSIFRSIEKHPEAQQIPGIAILRIDASFYFANVEFLQATIADIVEAPNPPKVILLDASAVNDLDSSGDSVFRDIYRDLKRHNIRLYIAGVKAPVREVLRRSGLYDEIGGEHFFYSVEAAVKRIETTESLTPENIVPPGEQHEATRFSAVVSHETRSADT